MAFKFFLFRIQFDLMNQNIYIDKYSADTVRRFFFFHNLIAEYDRDYHHNCTHYCLEYYIGLIERRPRSVYNAAPIKETVPKEFYRFLMRLDSPKEIVKALRLYLDTGTDLLKYLAYADSYDTLYACVVGNTVKNVPIETSVKIILPDLKRYDSLLKGGDAV